MVASFFERFRAWREGRKAKIEGVMVCSNPYLPGKPFADPELVMPWEKGFIYQSKLMKREG